MAGEITSLESPLPHLRESLVHMDATLRLYDPDADPTEIPGALHAREALWCAEAHRLILGALRRGRPPMTTGEVVAPIVAGLNYGPEAAKGVTNRVRANLR